VPFGLNGIKSAVVSAPPSLARSPLMSKSASRPTSHWGHLCPPLPVRGVAAYAARIRQIGNCREKIATRLENASMPNMPPCPTLLQSHHSGIPLLPDPAPSVALFDQGASCGSIGTVPLASVIKKGCSIPSPAWDFSPTLPEPALWTARNCSVLD
jgi:hypothetical protein